MNATVNGYGFNAVDTTYDFEDRLTQWKRANGAQNQSWSLTAVGDWQSQTVNGTATSRTHGPTHELTAIGASSLSYDAKGNLTQDTSRSPTQNYVWDYDNKMRSADIDGNGSADVSFEYDALGRRVARTQGADAVVYFQVDQQTICDYPRGGAAASPTYRYFWGSYIDELIARKATGTGGAVLFAHRNQQYSIYAYSNSSGAVVERIAYTAYGQPTFMNAAGTVQSTSPNSIRYSYTGREWDASLQLHHFRARWMGPVTGRFLSHDRIPAINYSLAFNGNCLANLDPTGNQAVCSDLACTNQGMEIFNQGVYGLFVEVEGKTCHGSSSSGCCNVGMGDAYLNMIYVEYNDDAALATAQDEWEINGSVLATRSDSGCRVTQKSRWVGKGIQIVIEFSCPIKCSANCRCEDPSATADVLCAAYRSVSPDPNGTTNLGLCKHFQRLSGSAILNNSDNCRFSGCTAQAKGQWIKWHFGNWGTDPWPEKEKSVVNSPPEDSIGRRRIFTWH